MKNVKIGSATLFNGDCMDYMRDLPDKFFDLAIVDPPYGIGNFSQKGNAKRNTRWKYTWNESVPETKYFLELDRISKNQIIWGANYYNCFNKLGGAIVWFKNVVHKDMSKCEIASCSIHKRVEFVHINWSNTDKYNSEKGHDIHPCQKPTTLYDWLLQNYAKPGQKILDTHLGSGSSAIAANKMGFEFVGIELDADYFEAACQRVADAAKQTDLFGGMALETGGIGSQSDMD